MNVELLTRIAEWLEAGAPEASFGYRFNMCDFFAGEERPYCGTMCCIAGAAIAMVCEPLAHYESNLSIEIFAAQLLGLDEERALSLFYAPQRRCLLIEIKPDYAARVVRHLIATGTVDWNV